MSKDIFKEEISTRVADVAEFSKDEILGLLELPRDTNLGDIALPCFTFAKKLRQSPQQIASQIGEKLQDVDWNSISEVKAVG
ncbi:MAG: arginine--tRNA ligase, partial [candidate division Zixibacteria bacterium]|nr:arginine--tRNA ligase [candidate division Zixibacteria bacterium]